MTTAKLKDLHSLEDVARACGIEPEFIQEYSDSPNQKSFFTALKLRKRGRRRIGEYRVVFAAKEARLASFHRAMSMIVTNSIVFGDHVQGFLKKRSTRSNAMKHLGAKILLHADIKGFFDAITTEQVRDAFVAEGTPVSMADLLSRACTIDGLLRQGTRCSPTLANLVCLPMDQSLLRLEKAHRCVYTRYADNLTFSGDEVPLDESIRAILESHGFSLRDDQCYRQYKGRSQYVTGLSVVEPDKPRLPKRLKHQLRLVMHYIEKYGLSEHWKRAGVEDPIREESWLTGMLMYAASIEPELVSAWQQTLAQAQIDYELSMHASDHAAKVEDSRLVCASLQLPRSQRT